MDDYTLDIDLEKKTTIMILPYVTMKYVEDETMNEMISILKKNSNMFIFTIDGNSVIIKIKYDFGVHLNDEVWKINSSLNNSMSRFMPNDDTILGYSNREFKIALFEYIKKNYLPSVIKILQKSADEFINQHNS